MLGTPEGRRTCRSTGRRAPAADRRRSPARCPPAGRARRRGLPGRSRPDRERSCSPAPPGHRTPRPVPCRGWTAPPWRPTGRPGAAAVAAGVDVPATLSTRRSIPPCRSIACRSSSPGPSGSARSTVSASGVADRSELASRGGRCAVTLFAPAGAPGRGILRAHAEALAQAAAIVRRAVTRSPSAASAPVVSLIHSDPCPRFRPNDTVMTRR